MDAQNFMPTSREKALTLWISAIAAENVHDDDAVLPDKVTEYTLVEPWMFTACRDYAIAHGWKILNSEMKYQPGDKMRDLLNQIEI